MKFFLDLFKILQVASEIFWITLIIFFKMKKFVDEKINMKKHSKLLT